MKINNTLFFFLFFFLVSQSIFGQDARRRLSMTQLVDEINATINSRYTLSNAEISPVDSDTDLGTITFSINGLANTLFKIDLR